MPHAIPNESTLAATLRRLFARPEKPAKWRASPTPWNVFPREETPATCDELILSDLDNTSKELSALGEQLQRSGIQTHEMARAVETLQASTINPAAAETVARIALAPPGAPLILYHANCPDGAAAAIFAIEFFRDDPHTEARPVRYGDPIPEDVDGRTVLVVDFSWRRDELLELEARAAELLVIDHHAGREKELEGLPFVIFDTTRSAARIVLDTLDEYLSMDVRLRFSWIAEYVQDRDLWTWKLPDSRAVSAYFSTLGFLPEHFEAWRAASFHGQPQAVTKGRAILAYQRTEIDSAILRSLLHTLRIGGEIYAVPVVNVSGRIISEVAHELAVKYSAPFAVAWFVDERDQVVVSLRSTSEGVAVLELAKHLGGGGHLHAAGATFHCLEDWCAFLYGTSPNAGDPKTGNEGLRKLRELSARGKEGKQ